MKSILHTNGISEETKASLLGMHPSAYDMLTVLAQRGHLINAEAGWWTDLETGKAKDRNYGELSMLVVSEVAEGMEGHRKGLRDDHLPQYPMWWVEMADAIIRIFDMVGSQGVPIGEVVYQKMIYNAARADHKPENRAKADGKKY